MGVLQDYLDSRGIPAPAAEPYVQSTLQASGPTFSILDDIDRQIEDADEEDLKFETLEEAEQELAALPDEAFGELEDQDEGDDEDESESE